MFDIFGYKKHEGAWRNGVYLTTAGSSFEADILESKLRAEGIPSEKRYAGASNFLEISMGFQNAYPIEIYVPEQELERAQEAIVPVPIDDDFEEMPPEEAETAAELDESSDLDQEDGKAEAEDGGAGQLHSGTGWLAEKEETSE